ncbi:hypothetical protein EV284_4178 [Streptomyces sp. BK022]|uniref:hypothetical protein n=1 Tax=Streptomyces sp. BK022 TaxID=2512123 RepID=UPI0010294BC8|nr:hypothetical protein [Streptomyces sp. BK022]RZU36680.1 hypothetical protein EV284_4178 [Streptomyces sp. BK022]
MDSGVLPVGVWWAAAAIAAIVYLAVYPRLMPTQKTTRSVLVGPLMIGLLVAVFYARDGSDAPAYLGAFTGAMIALPLAIAGQHRSLVPRVVAREAGVPNDDLPSIPASLKIRIIVTLPLMTCLGIWLGIRFGG